MAERKYLVEIAADPLNWALHRDYAIALAERRQFILAYAEMKTAEYLGAQTPDTLEWVGKIEAKLPAKKRMNHNTYYRLKSLADEIRLRAGPLKGAVLDVGGGQGALAGFLTDFRYCLVEPRSNGLCGTSLPFPDRAFDYVVSCHVLEHIPTEERSVFLDQLVAKARKGVILLNPFQLDGIAEEERLRLIIDLTGARWAKEHLDCSLPRLADVQSYASCRGLEFSCKPNATLSTTLALVFLDHFAAKFGANKELARIHGFFNEMNALCLDSPASPTASLVLLGVNAGAI